MFVAGWPYYQRRLDEDLYVGTTFQIDEDIETSKNMDSYDKRIMKSGIISEKAVRLRPNMFKKVEAEKGSS